MYEFSSRVSGSPDALFFERLDTFMDKCLSDIKAFSEREHRPFEETRQYVAEWHAKYLFQSSLVNATNLAQNSTSKVLSVLYDTSRALESLCEVTGVQSFVLAVDPTNPSDGGFLGGSITGREFWRGLRSGGEAGAKAFKNYCLRDLDNSPSGLNHDEGPSSNRSSSTAPAKSLKSDLYDHVRKSLRAVSGVRNAEMKWTNPERLDIYGVRLVGWPPTIPAQNPSSLKATQNKELLRCLEAGTMRFDKIGSHDGNPDYNTEPTTKESDEDEDFSWAYDADGVDPAIAEPSFDSALNQGLDSHSEQCGELPNKDDAWSSTISESDRNSMDPPSRKRPRNDSTEFEKQKMSDSTHKSKRWELQHRC